MTLDWVIVVLGDLGTEAVATTVADVRREARDQARVVVARDVAAFLPEGPRAGFVSFVAAGDLAIGTGIDALSAALREEPQTDLVYGDAIIGETLMPEEDAFHRPSWSPERLLSQNYLGSMVTYRASLLDLVDIDGFADQTALQQLHDLALQMVHVVSLVVHLPTLLCVESPAHRDLDLSLSVRGLQRHFDRMSAPAHAVATAPGSAGNGMLGFRPVLDRSPLVSIVIPTGGSTRTIRGENLVLVDNAIRSVVEESSYSNVEIVVVVDAKSTQELAERLAGLDERVRIVKDHRPFNFAAACNLGASVSSGDLIVLLNDDTEVVTADWIERLVVLTSMEDVGAVGVKLLYGDGRLQHGGVMTRGTSPDHLYHGYPSGHSGHHGWLDCIVNSFATTGACLAVRRDQWNEVDGMDERFPLNYNDVDLCLRLHSRGWRTVVDNQTVLTHLETSSRPAGSESWEVEAFRESWGAWLDNDPYDNPNFSNIGLLQIARPSILTKLSVLRGRTYKRRLWHRSTGHQPAQPATRAS